MKDSLNALALALCLGMAATHAEDLKFFWYKSTIDTNLGIWGTSGASFDAHDSLKVSYRGHQHDMKYAELNPNFTWRIEQADTNYTGGPAQMAATLASNGQPHIIYQTADYQKVYGATKVNGKWEHRLQDHLDIVNLDFYQMSMAADDKGGVHMIYSREKSGWPVLYYAYRDKDGNTKDTGFVSSEITGKWSSMTTDSKGSPVLAYFRVLEERLEVAYRDSGSWKRQIVGIDLPKIPFGYHISIARASDTLYRILYQDRNVHQMWMASGVPGGAWTTEKIDSLDGYTNFTALNVLKLGKDGMPYIAYANIKSPDGYQIDGCKLMFAYKSDGAWHKQVLDSNGIVGEYASMAIDSKGQPAITYFDRDRHQLKLIFGSFTELTAV
jgi:hypothetical protein